MFVRHKRFFLFFAVAMVAFASAYAAYASSKADIVHPVAELGGCRDEAACRNYCDARDDLERVRACIAFAKKYNLLPAEDLEEADRYAVRLGIAAGPGGCRDTRSCEQYCEDTAHLGECLDFAEKHGLRSAEEIAEGRRLVSVLAQGATLPGGCGDRKTCEAYCEDPAHMRACVAFAKQAGFISEDEAVAAEKIIPIIEAGGKTPGNCGRKAACETYCAIPGHIDECIAFAERAGLMDAEELAEAKKFAPLIKRGETPGQCRGKDACEQYCGDPAHFEECVVFGERAGILSADDAALARKTKGVGPGGCRSKQACEAFCTDPAHQQECMAFAEQHGLTEEFSGAAAEVRARMEAEGLAKGNAEADVKLRACGEKSCGEMIACLQGVGARNGGGEKDVDGGEHTLPGDVQEKLNACVAEETARQVREATEGGEDHAVPSPQQTPRLPDGGPVGNQSETERRTREEQQRQYDEEVRRRTEAEIKRQTEIQTKSQVDCSLFAAAPKCEYAGPVGSDNYNYCKQCYPER